MNIRNVLTLLLTLSLTGCIAQDYKTYKRYLASKNLPPISSAQFPHCYGYGCPGHYLVELNQEDWKAFDAMFTPPSQNSEEERARIAQAVGLFERKVGKLTGTEVDHRGTFLKMGQGQLDCVDESTNTTIYIELLKQRGHVRYHDILQPQVRTPFTGGGGRWVHQTATIRDITTNIEYAVDSWFENNGFPPYIVTLSSWRDGWRPPRKEDE